MTTLVTSDPTTTTPQRPARDAPGGIPFLRLVHVELRKMLDTRAGRWLLVVIGLVTLAVVVIVFFVADDADLTLANFVAATATPQSLLLPLLGVMAVTSEWGQRTALVTFTLEPRRLRVLAAKLVAALALGLASIVFAYAVAAAATLLGEVLRDGAGGWDLSLATVGGTVLAQLLTVTQGVGFGLLFANTAVAIVAYLVLPTAWAIVGSLVSALETPARWLDLSRTVEPLAGGQMTGELWAQLGTSAALWVVAPVVIGTWRLLRREVK